MDILVGVENIERQIQILMGNFFPTVDISAFPQNIPSGITNRNTVILLDWTCLGRNFPEAVQRLQWEICTKRSTFSVWLQGAEEALHIKETLSMNGLNCNNLIPPSKEESSKLSFQGTSEDTVRISIAKIETRGEQAPKQNEVPATIFDALVMMFANPSIHFGDELLLPGSAYRIGLGGEAILSIKTTPRGTTGKRSTRICANPKNRVPHGMPAIYLQCLQPQN